MQNFLRNLFARSSQHEESQTVNADFLYDGTDALWRAVIDNLPEEIKCNVSASAGKAYIHIKPKSTHLGAKDFKYCVEYSKQYIDNHSADCIVKSVVPQQGVKNKDKWKWEVTAPAKELNNRLVKWYVDTITTFWFFFEN